MVLSSSLVEVGSTIVIASKCSKICEYGVLGSICVSAILSHTCCASTTFCLLAPPLVVLKKASIYHKREGWYAEQDVVMSWVGGGLDNETHSPWISSSVLLQHHLFSDQLPVDTHHEWKIIKCRSQWLESLADQSTKVQHTLLEDLEPGVFSYPRTNGLAPLSRSPKGMINILFETHLSTWLLTFFCLFLWGRGSNC